MEEKGLCTDKTRQKPREGQVTKGSWWIPRHTEAKKDVVTDDMLRGVGSKQRSGGFRMGQPNNERANPAN